MPAAPRSMTGYGAARANGSRLGVEAEIRSVNARSFKLNLRSPPLLAPHEADIEALVKQHVRRGTVSLYLRVDLLRPEDTVRVRPETVEGLARSLEPLYEKGLLEGRLTPDAIVSIPGALETGPEQPLRPVDWRVVKKALVDALAALDAMREREAGHLVKDLLHITKGMRTKLAAVKRRAPAIVRENEARLRERVDALLEPRDIQIDETTLAREIAVLADRADITEEITRLAAHLDEFEGYLNKGGEIGRTLDFLCQEILRETNTIGSKSNDVATARQVIALKSAVDRLKEQSANLE